MTHMIVVAVGDHHVLDVSRVEADLPDVVEKAIDVAILECVDEDQALVGGQQPARHITDAYVVEIVERLERWHRRLQLHVLALFLQARRALLRGGADALRTAAGPGRQIPGQQPNHRGTRQQHPDRLLHHVHPLGILVDFAPIS
jgi:hypothetical protein